VTTLLSYRFLIPLALLLGLAPFYPQPHLLEKLGMLLSGTLLRPIDIFDLVWHAWPGALLLYRIGRDIGRRSG
jgi:hypothetical protein